MTAGAERRAREARAATIGSWSEVERIQALTELAGRWPDIFDAIRDQVDGSEEGDRDG